ncbi:MAG: Zn-dependent hydrolase [Acidaminococcus sp.]|jgi:N-carbamoyl-L-amino-acid hydrolase|nr:Zn-dependent hydrolase [Acidaminococcus sp.]MCI2114188.1 Zn-dependent hydrolase [Acidaminococcus sp.]MCI2116123.1 Zn-dependent hydrolase [Acidaminococcus sp.]
MDINGKHILDRIHKLGSVGIGADGRRTRLAASDTNKEGRDLVVSWMKDAGLRVVVDYIGNIFGIWETEANKNEAPIMTGSHIDTVINAGQYDGCLGVISGIEVVKTLKDAGLTPKRPLIVGVFTNEEGVRYSPDMMGSLVYAGGLDLKQALVSIGTDGTILGDELKRIGYAGTVEPGFVTPKAFVELHIEQGPIMDAEGISIGAVENLQGIHWQRITIEGAANHAGTTPTRMRRDAGLAAAKVNVFARQLVEKSGGVATVGTIVFEPNAVNVIPSKAVFTLDLRNPDKVKLDGDDADVGEYLKTLEKTDGVKITSEHMTCFDPVPFDDGICRLIEKSARARGLSVRRMVSGAGQDAQMLARICPTAMIFVPSVNGISHNPKEFSRDEDVQNGANVLLDVLTELSGAK